MWGEIHCTCSQNTLHMLSKCLCSLYVDQCVYLTFRCVDLFLKVNHFHMAVCPVFTLGHILQGAQVRKGAPLHAFFCCAGFPIHLSGPLTQPHEMYALWVDTVASKTWCWQICQCVHSPVDLSLFWAPHSIAWVPNTSIVIDWELADWSQVDCEGFRRGWTKTFVCLCAC